MAKKKKKKGLKVDKLEERIAPAMIVPGIDGGGMDADVDAPDDAGADAPPMDMGDGMEPADKSPIFCAVHLEIDGMKARRIEKFQWCFVFKCPVE